MPADDPLYALYARLVADEVTPEELRERLLFHVQTLLELRDGLIEANRSRGGKSAGWDRISVHQVAHATNRLLRAHGMQDLSAPLVLIDIALLDLEHGLVAAMLRPRRDGDRVSWRSMKFRGYAAGIMGGLMQHADMPRDEAATWVAKRLRAAGYQVRPRTVTDWRQDALSPDSSADLRDAYRTIIEKGDWSAPLAGAEQMMAALIALLPRKTQKTE